MRIGFIGSGHIGGAVAKLAVDAGHEVIMSNSRMPDTLADLVAQLGPNASAALAADAAQAGELVVVTIPFKNYLTVPAAPLAGKVVVDTNNYYPQRDGQYPAIDAGETAVSELLAAHLPQSMVLKAFNNIGSGALLSDGLPAGDPDRRALAIAGDDASAKAVLSSLIDSFGFDVVDAGPLKEGRRYDRDTPAYGPRMTVAQLTDALAKAF